MSFSFRKFNQGATSPPPIITSKTAIAPTKLNTETKKNSTEELIFIKAEKIKLEAELQASMDNLLLVVDEVKFLEDEVCSFNKGV